MSLLKPTSDTPAVYFKDLTIANIRCFKEEQTISFTNAKGEPAQWTVILGNNNTGKTTLLRCLESFGTLPFHLRWTFGKEREKEKYAPRRGFPFVYYNPNQDFNSLKSTFVLYEDDSSFDFEINKIKEIKSVENDYTIPDFEIDFYPIPRTTGKERVNEQSISFDFDETVVENLISTQKWLLQTDYAAKNGKENAQKYLNQVKKILVDILPDVYDFRFQTTEKDTVFKSWVEFKTDYGWVRFKDLGYGYKSLMAWMVDFAIRLFNRYPESKNPLAEPAIALVDEIDLHLHPDWQRKVISHLSKHFPRTQFIVTAHSPLVIQSANEVNVVLLEADKDNGRVLINQPEIENYQGWTIEEILTEIMGLGDKVRSDDYLSLMESFDQALDDENYDTAMQAYDALDKILHPYSNQRKLMKLQLTSIKPVLIAQ